MVLVVVSVMQSVCSVWVGTVGASCRERHSHPPATADAIGPTPSCEDCRALAVLSGLCRCRCWAPSRRERHLQHGPTGAPPGPSCEARGKHESTRLTDSWKQAVDLSSTLHEQTPVHRARGGRRGGSLSVSQKEDSGLARLTRIRDVALVVGAPGAGAKVFERAVGDLEGLVLRGEGMQDLRLSLPAPQACVQRNWDPAAPLDQKESKRPAGRTAGWQSS